MSIRAVMAGLVMSLIVFAAFAALPAKVVSAAADEDVFYIAMQEDLPDFNNYNLGSNSVWKYYTIGMGFESLATADADLRPIPLLAEDWVFDELNLTVDVYLREGVKFHDDTEMTADDVRFSYMMARNGTTYSDNIIPAFDGNDDNIVSWDELDDGITVVSDYHVRMVMAKEFGQFFSSTLGVPIVPMHIWEDHVDALDEVIVTWGDDPIAATGTGPWYYAEGVTNSYRVMKKFDDYWGKDHLTPAGMPVFPNVIDTIHYKIYASIDTAILALQGGQVNYIAWAVTAGRIPGLQSDPNIELEYMSDAGYFYMAFNMKKEPMNNLSFRKAVSHLIDKEQIVDIYMGGFGQAGSAAVSPYFGEWHNPAVTKYSFDIDAANAILDAAGFDDDNGDGWRDLPDGRIMEKITLMTPPADYDPIRIRAGQMIATNMRAAGINVEAKPIDFNTLVAKLVAFDYQMLIIGWNFSGYTECVSVLYDIYGPAAAANSWAFWSDSNPNPYYSDIGGVSTLADDATIEMVDDFAQLEDDARGTFDVAEQIDLVKQGQQIIADAVPCNVLYYRVNVEAHDKVWTNWTEFDGSMMNSYNLCTLEYSGTGGAEGGGAVTTTLSAGLTMPGKVKCTESIDAYVKAIDNLGEPFAGASVTVDATDGVAASPATGTTDENGVFGFTVTGETVGVSTITVNVTSDSLEATDSAGVVVSSLGGLAVQVMPEKTVLVAGEDIEVDLLVTDVMGLPVEGATVTIDPYLLGYGSLDPESGTLATDANGEGTMTYTAPAKDLNNTHMLVTLAASVQHPMYSMSNLATSSIVVYNDVPPDWYLTAIESVTATALTGASPTTTIEVMAMDASGTALADEELGVTYSNEDILVSPVVTTVTTDGTGLAEFDVTIDDTIDMDTALRVTIGKRNVANSIMDTVTLTYADAGGLTDMYGGYVQYAVPKFIEGLADIDLTVYVYDSEGTPADGVNATAIVGASAYGSMTTWPDAEMDSLAWYAGINIVTDGDEQNLVTAGAFATPSEDLGFIGVEITGGTYDMTVMGVGLAQLDLALDVFLCPNSTGTYNGITGNFDISGQTTISSSYGYGRATALTTVTYEIEKPVMKAKDTEFEVMVVSVTAYDESNTPIEGAEVALYTLGDYGIVVDDGDPDDPADDGPVDINWGAGEATNTTDVDGTATFNVTAASENTYPDVPEYGDITRAFDGISREVNPDMYVVARAADSMLLFSQTQLVIEPFRESVYVELEPMQEVYAIGDKLHVVATIVDSNGEPYPDLPVTIGTGEEGSVAANTILTDDDGVARFVVDTPGVEDAEAALMAISLTTGGAPEGSAAKMMVALQNMGPDIEITAPEADGEVVGPDATITAAVHDSNGIGNVTLKLDDDAAMSLSIDVGSVAAAISEVLEDIDDGEHTVIITATDSLGISSQATIDFTVVEGVADGDGEADMLAWALAAIGWIVAAIVLVLLVMKMRPKKPAEMPSEMEMEEPEPEPMMPEPEAPAPEEEKM